MSADGKVVTLLVDATDPLTSVGTIEALRPFPDLHPLPGPENGTVADVVIVLVDTVDADALRRIRRARCPTDRPTRPVALVVASLDEDAVIAAVEAGARAILRRRDAVPAALADLARRAAQGEGWLPADVLGRLLEQVSRISGDVLAPRGLRMNGLSERETTILRLVAEGIETAEIARKLNYSERTIKSVLHDVTTRLHLHNRAHAVAYALRTGLI